MNRVISYIDGFNLYFGLRSKGWKRYYWLNLPAVTRALLKPGQQFLYCHYFTARIRSQSQSQNRNRQNIWLDALATRGDIRCHFGHYLSKTKKCRNCGAEWTSHEEKMPDVNIASQLLADSYENRFDTAIVMLADSDLTTPIKTVLEKFKNKRIIVVFPPCRRSDQLRKTATACFTLGEAKLRHNLMPNEIKTSTGFVMKRPQEWY